MLLAQALLNKRQDLASLWRLTRAEVLMAVASSGAMVCFIAAFFFTTVADVVFIYSAFPILTLLLSALLLRSAISRVDVLCTLAVVGGMGVIVWGQTSLHNLVGAALSLLATLLFALITIGIKRYPQAEMVKVTYVGAFIAALAGALADDGLMILSTPNRTAKSRLLLVEGAERLGMIPRGTHHWEDFITPDELRKVVDNTFAKDATFQKTFMGFNVSTVKEKVMEMSSSDIPDSQLKSIRDAYKQRGIENPTEQDILGVYWTMRDVASFTGSSVAQLSNPAQFPKRK